MTEDQQMYWVKLPILGVGECVIPVTPDGRALDKDGDPLPMKQRTHTCKEMTRWMLNNPETLMCQKHAGEVAMLAGDNIDEIEAAIREQRE